MQEKSHYPGKNGKGEPEVRLSWRSITLCWIVILAIGTQIVHTEVRHARMDERIKALETHVTQNTDRLWALIKDPTP